MSMPQRIEVRVGAAPWLLAARQLVFVLAGTGLVLSGASWPWKSLALLGLLLAWTGQRGATGPRSIGRLVLHLDGRSTWRTAGTECHGVARQAAWVSRWFCIVRWTGSDGGRSRSALVCASENHPDDYRRLLAWSRLGVFSGEERVA